MQFVRRITTTFAKIKFFIFISNLLSIIALVRLCTIEPHSVHNSRVKKNHHGDWEKCCERKPSKTVSFAHPLLRPHLNAVIYFLVKVLNQENWRTYDNSKDPRKWYDHLECQGKCMMQCTYFKYSTIRYKAMRCLSKIACHGDIKVN